MTRFRFGKTPLAALLVLALPAAAAWAQSGNGLYGEYFNTGDWTGPVVETRLGEGPIDFFYPKPPGTPSTDDPATNGTGGPQGPIFTTKSDNFSAIWRGKVESPMGTAGYLKFRVQSDDLARLYINGSQVISVNVNIRESANIAVTANQMLDLVLMHQEWGGLAYIHLEWAYGTAVDPTNWELVPQNRLYSPTAVATVPTPQATPNGGLVPLGGSQDVYLSITPPDDTNTVIYYSTNGTNPDIIYRTPPPAGVQLYNNGTPIVISQYGIIRARAYTISGPNVGLVSPLFISNVYSADFPPAVPPTGATEPGLYFRFFDIAGLNILPNFDGLIPEIRGGMPQFRIEFPSTTSRPKGDQFGLVHTGYFEVPAGAGGGWRFYLRSDDGSKLFIDGIEVVDNDGLHGTNGFPGKEGGPITLQAGKHTIRVEMFENGGGESLYVNYRSPSMTVAQEIPASMLSRDPITATPTVTPNGGNFGETVDVTMSCTTPDSFLYWTTDGSPPNPYNPIQHQGSGPSGSTITIHRDTVLRVLATAPFQNPSEIKRLNFWRSPLLLSAQANSLAPRELLLNFDKSIDAAGLSDLNNFTVSGAVVNSASLVSKAGLGVLRAHWKMDEGVDFSPLDDSSTLLNQGIDQPDTLVTNPATGTQSTYAYFLPFSDNEVAPLLGANTASRYFFSYDDIVRVESSPSLQFGESSFTFAFWMRPNGGRVARRIINKWYPGVVGPDYNDRMGWMLDLNNPGEGIVRFFMRDAGGREVRAEVYMDPPDNVWQHIAVRVDREKGRVFFFRDGVLWGSRTMASNVLSPDTTVPMFIGNIAQPIAPVEFFIGNLDDFRIYSTGLTDGEIQGLAAGGDQVSTMVRVTTVGDLPASGTVTVRNLKAVGTNTIAIPASGYTAAFTVQTTGSVLQENYTGITGGEIPNLTLNGLYPAGSSSIQSMPSLLMVDPGGGTDTNNYGVRMRGYFVPPSDSATWRFALNSDDHGQFWLSPDENPANKILISKVVGWASPSPIQYNKAGVSYQSGDINLLQGKRYYFEALVKEGSGGDNMAVAASPSGATIADGTAPILAVGQLIPMRDPLVVLRHPHSKVLPLNGSVTFDAVIGGTGRLTYQWYKNGTTPVGTGSTFTIASAVVADGGFYHLQVTNPDTSETVSTQQARLVVYSTASPPTLTAAATPNPNPNTGSAGGGNTVTITGTNFIDGATFVSFGVNYGTQVTVAPAGDSLTVVVPPGPVSTVSVRVTTPLGFATLSNAYTYVTAPTVTSVSTALANGYSSGLTTGTNNVFVTGTGFGGGTTAITFGGVSGTIVSVDSATQLTVNVPPSALGAIGPVAVEVFNGALNSAPLPNGWYYWNPPTLTQISPNSGPAAGGNQVTLVGTSFAPGMTVTFQGLGNATIAVQPTGPTWDSMQITVPQNAVGGGVNVFVTNPNPAISPSSGTLVYTYYVPPTVGTLTTNNPPFNAASGPLAGGTPVTIDNGSGFISGQTTVHFTSAGGTVDVLPPNVTVNMLGTQITFNAPAGLATGTVSVTVETPGGTTSALTYTYYAAPTITPGGIAAVLAPFNTADGPKAGGTTVTITGSNFVVGATNVIFGGLGSIAASVNGLGTSLSVVAPNGTTLGAGVQAVDITVQTPGGNSPVVSSGYAYHDPPTGSITVPASATGPTNGGTAFTISGTNLPLNLTQVTFDGVVVPGVTANGTSVSGQTPQHAAGAAAVAVTTPGGSNVSVGTFTYNAGPYVSDISPGGGTTGASSPPPVTITGTGFTAGSTVDFGAAGAGTVTSVSGTQIVVTPPSSLSVQTVNVTVTSSGEVFTVTNGYSYVTAPVITSLSVTQGPIGGGQAMTIDGSGFVVGDTVVRFGTTSVTPSSITANQLILTTPPGTIAGTLQVTVRTLDLLNSNPSPYTYWNPPSVASIVPQRGPSAGGQTVTITGTNFVDGFTQVSIGGNPATSPVVTSSTTLTCVTPAGTGSASIIVTTFDPPGQSSVPVSLYTYVDSLTSIDLSLTLGVDNSAPNVGDDVTLILTLDNTNGGGVAGSGISVNMAVPAGLSLVSAVPSVGTYVGGVWTVGNLANGANATLTVVATVVSPSTVTIVAEVAAATQADVDSIPNNGFSFEDDRATVVVDADLVITTPLGLPDATSGAVYSQSLAASGGNPPLTWSLVSSTPAFPFSLNPSTGVIGGTAPTVAGPLPTTYSFTIRVTDTSGDTATAGLFTIDVYPPAPAGTVTVNATPAPADGTVGVAYTHTFSASGATAPYTWSVSLGSVPAGLTLNTSTGTLAGTPLTANTYNFTLTATPASGTADTQAFSIVVNSNPVTFVTPAGPLAGGTVGSPYSQLVEVSGGVGSTFTWTLAAGTLPNGVAPPAGTGRTATLSGTPTTPGTFNFDLRAADDGQPGLEVTRAFSITIVATGSPTPFSVTTTVLPSGTQGQLYTGAGAQLTGTGGTTPYTWSILTGSLPAGLTLNAGTGAITGTPTASGSYSLTFQGSDAAAATDTADLTIDIASVPVVTTTTLPGAVRNAAYFVQLQATGGTGALTWSEAGLPAGLVLDPSSGAISGAPTDVAGNYPFTVTATDAAGAASSPPQPLSIDITDPGSGFAISTTSLPSGLAGVPYSFTLQSVGATGPVVWTITNAPPWAAFDVNTGTITGLPTAGTFNPGFSATDGATTDPAAGTLSLTLQIDPALAITTAVLPGSDPGVAYAATLVATGGVAPETWSILSGTLPPGLSLSSSGAISGITAGVGTYVFTVQVQDGQGRSDQRQLSILVAFGASITPDSGSSGKNCSMAAAEPASSLLPFAALLLLGAFALRKRNLA